MKKILIFVLAFSLIFVLGISAFAEEEYPVDSVAVHYSASFSQYPDLPDYDAAAYPYAIIYPVGDTVKLYLMSAELRSTNNGLYYKTDNNSLIYKIEDDAWVYDYESSSSADDKFGATSSVVASSYNIKRSDNTTVDYYGDVNFHPPRPLMVIVREEMTGVMVPTVAKTVTILASLGVGCLALLIGLTLLAKKFPQFLGR